MCYLKATWYLACTVHQWQYMQYQLITPQVSRWSDQFLSTTRVCRCRSCFNLYSNGILSDWTQHYISSFTKIVIEVTVRLLNLQIQQKRLHACYAGVVSLPVFKLSERLTLTKIPSLWHPQVEVYCNAKGLSIVGYYHANERLDDSRYHVQKFNYPL